jgi:hypothetical protein
MFRADAAVDHSHRALVRRFTLNVLVIVTAVMSFMYLTYAILFPDRF